MSKSSQFYWNHQSKVLTTSGVFKESKFHQYECERLRHGGEEAPVGFKVCMAMFIVIETSPRIHPHIDPSI